MKEIRVKNNGIVIGSNSYLRDYLVSLGIDEAHVDAYYQEPTNMADIDNPYDLENMERGLTRLYAAITEGAKVYVQADCDTDGFTSASIFCQYFKMKYPDLDLRYGVHSGKEHGIEMDKVQDADVVIIPDAGSMQLEEQQQLDVPP